MKDLLLMLLTLAFFTVSWVYVLACDRLDPDAREDKS